MAVSDDVAWTVTDFVVAGVLFGLIGAAFELAARRTGHVVLGAALIGLGVAATVVGEVDDAPGLVVIGALLAVSGAAVMYRRLQGAT